MKVFIKLRNVKVHDPLSITHKSLLAQIGHVRRSCNRLHWELESMGFMSTELWNLLNDLQTQLRFTSQNILERERFEKKKR